MVVQVVIIRINLSDRFMHFVLECGEFGIHEFGEIGIEVAFDLFLHGL